MHDNVIIRTIIELPEAQIAALGEYCERERISRAEAIRRAVDAMLAARLPAERSAAFGGWARRGDSRALVDELRQEWD